MDHCLIPEKIRAGGGEKKKKCKNEKKGQGEETVGFRISLITENALSDGKKKKWGKRKHGGKKFKTV